MYSRSMLSYRIWGGPSMGQQKDQGNSSLEPLYNEWLAVPSRSWNNHSHTVILQLECSIRIMFNCLIPSWPWPNTTLKVMIPFMWIQNVLLDKCRHVFSEHPERNVAQYPRPFNGQCHSSAIPGGIGKPGRVRKSRLRFATATTASCSAISYISKFLLVPVYFELSHFKVAGTSK